MEADRGLSYGDLEAIAAHIRHKLKIDTFVPLPALQLFERLDQMTVTLPGRTVPLTYAVEEQEREGRTYFDTSLDKIVVTVSEATYLGLENDLPRDRFTLAHEVSHPLCQPELILRLPQLDHERIALMRGSSTHPKFRDVEWQANSTAAALLMPVDGLVLLEKQGRLTVRELEEMYLVSRQSATYRIDNFRRFRQRMVVGAERGKRMP